MTPAIAPGVALVPVQGIWNFTGNKIARQLRQASRKNCFSRPGASLEASFFAMVEHVCAAALRGEHPEQQEQNGDA